MNKNLPIKSALIGAFFVGLILGSALPVGVVEAAPLFTPRPGGLLVTQKQKESVSPVAVQVKSFFAGMDGVLVAIGRAVSEFLAGVERNLVAVKKPVVTPRPVAQVPQPPSAKATGDEGVVLGVEDDVAELGNRVAVLESKDASGDTSVSLGTLAIQGDNLVRNSSFEVSDSNDTPRYWNYQLDSSYGNTFKSAEGIRSGKYGLKFLGGAHGGLGVSQPDTKLEPGRSYMLSLYVKAVNVGTATLNFGFWDEVANARGTMKNVSYSGTKDWHRVSLVVEHPALSDKGKKWFPLIEVNNLGAGNIYIDDVQLSEGTVVSSYNSDLGDDAGQILGGGAVLVDNNGNVFPAKDGIGELGMSGSKFKALTLSKASIDKDGNTTIDGATTLKGGVTLGDETSDTITFNGTVAGFTLTGSATYNDDVKLSFGTGGPADILWETADANANELIVAFDEGGSVDVPVLVVGDASIDNVDLGMFNGVASPSVAVISDDAGDYVRLYVTDAGVATLLSGTGDIALMPDADTGDYVTLSSDGTDLTLATTDSANLTITPAGKFSATSNSGTADAVTLISTAGGIDISTGTGTAGNDIDILAGASINLTAAENVADSIVLTSSAGGIDILASAASAGEDIDVIATGSSVNLQSTEGVVNAITLVSTGGGIDISTGTGTAGNDIDILAGASINLTALENAADAIVLSTNRGGIDISTGNDTNAIDILSGAALNLTTAVGGGQLALTSNRSNAAAVLVAAVSGGIDISTGTGTAGNDIDVLAGASINLTAQESVADAIVLSAPSGGIDISTGGSTRDIDILSGDAINLTGAGQLALTSNQGAATAMVLVSSAGGIDISTGTGTAGNDIDILAGASINLTAAESAVDSIVLTSSAGGIDILATGAAAGEDIDITATGSSVNITATESVANAVVIAAPNGGIDMSTGYDAGAGQAIDILGGATINIKASNGDISLSAGSGFSYASGITVDSATGRVGISMNNPAHALDVVGTAGLSTGTAWTSTSDIRFKNIESELYGSSLDLVMALHPVTFTWNELHASKYGGDPGVNYGFIAQEVAQVIPEFITQNDEGYYLYNPSGIEAVLTASIQEQQGQITYLYDSLGLTYVAPAEAEAAAVTEEVVTQEVSGEVLAQTDAAVVAEDDLVVKMAATFEGTLVVKGAATFDGVLTVNGVAVVQELDVAGAITQTFTAGEAVNPGEAVAIVGENTVGKGSPVIGVVASSATAGQSVKVAIAGTVGGFSGLTPGQVVYAGEQAIGVARSATQVLVMPNLPNKTVEPPVSSPPPPTDAAALPPELTLPVPPLGESQPATDSGVSAQ